MYKNLLKNYEIYSVALILLQRLCAVSPRTKEEVICMLTLIESHNYKLSSVKSVLRGSIIASAEERLISMCCRCETVHDNSGQTTQIHRGQTRKLE